MEKSQKSEGLQNQYNERILDLFRTLKQDVREYSDKKKKEYDLTGPQFLLIDVLYRNPGINLHDLSEQLRMAKSNVSVIVERLVCKGIVMREIPEDNRRMVKLSLTPEFKEQCTLLKNRNKFWEGFLGDATEAELAAVVNGLEKLHEIILRNKALQSGSAPDSDRKEE